MTVQTQVVRFTKDTSNTDNATQDVNLNFTPKAILLFSDCNTADNTVSAHHQWCQGFSDGTTHACITITSDDADTVADTQTVHSASVYARMLETNNGTVEERATCAFATNKVTFTWVTNSADATRIIIWAIGGNDITNVKVNSVAVGRTTTGTQDYTGLGFTPADGDSVLFTLSSFYGTPDNISATNASLHFGCAVSATKEWAVANVMEDLRDPSDTWSVLYNNHCLVQLGADTGAEAYTAEFSTWITDGFRLNYTNAPEFSTYNFSYLVIKGGTWDNGVLTAPSSATNDVDTAVSVSSRTLRGLMLASTAQSTANTISAVALGTVGATDGTNQASIGFIDEDAQATMDSYRVNTAVSIARAITTNGAALHTAAFDSFTTNNFRLDWSASTALLYGWVVVADGAATLFERSINEATISVSETLGRTKIIPRAITESTISVSDSNARLLTANRSISESSISVSETLARIIIFPRTINESTIVVSETVARQLLASRALAEPAISVSETLARLFLANRIISESTINVSETVTGNLFFLRGITEPSISVSETLARQLLANRSISESSISVSETLARILTALRAINESTISVSETVNRNRMVPRSISENTINVSETLDRQTFNFRTISESTISVSETVNRILTAFRTISESAISVSETVTGVLPVITRSINEPAISVSETVARQSIKFRIITEPSISVSETLVRNKYKVAIITEAPITVSDSVVRRLSVFRVILEPTISVSEVVLGIEPFTTFAKYIVDPGYTNTVRCRITFKSRKSDTEAHESGDQIIYYQYDAFNTSNRPFNLIDMSLRLVQGEISAAGLDIEDHAEVVDKRKISYKSVVEIEFKKEEGREWKRVLTGFVRRIRTLRPRNKALIYRVIVLSKQIQFSERITNFKRAAKRTNVDSPDALTTDKKMQTKALFRDFITSKDAYPLKGPTLEESGEFDMNSGSISEEVTDFVTQIAPGLTTGSEVANQITEGTGAIWGSDEFGNPYLRYPSEKHSGIIIKDSPNDTDSALNTSVNMDSFEFEDVIDIAEGFANRIYVLNSKDTKSIASSSKAQGFTTLTTRWIAQSWVAEDNNVTGAAFILSKIGEPTNTDNTIVGMLRASSPSGNFPTGPTLATFEISISSLSHTADVIFVNDLKTNPGVIIPGQRYWWVLKGKGFNDDSNTVKWHHDNDLFTDGRPASAIGPQVDNDPTKAGLQFTWQRNPNGPVYAFSTFASIRHILTQSDPESIETFGLIEQVVSLPAFDDDATFKKVLAKIIQDSAKMKRIYDITRVTIPTDKLFLPGELVTVVDSKASLDEEKTINAEIVEVTYNFNTSTNALGCKYVDLRLVGHIDTVIDEYLENREC